MGKQAFMPGFGDRPTDANPLSNRDMTALGNYVLTHFGAAGAAITEQQVAEVRRGGPSSPLLMLARGGMAAAAVVLLGVAFVLFRRRKTSSTLDATLYRRVLDCSGPQSADTDTWHRAPLRGPHRSGAPCKSAPVTGRRRC